MREINYFIFTSGEDGQNGFDWGIKFASAALSNKLELETYYRALLKKFGLSPSLERERPLEGSAGLLLLPSESRKLLIFILPGSDVQGRLNTAAIVCSIPIDLSSSFSVRETARRIWSANNLIEIAKHGAARPDTLIFPNETAPSIDYPFAASSGLINWPDDNKAYLSVNQNIKELARLEAVSQTEDIKMKIKDIKPEVPVNNNKNKILFAAGALIALIILGLGFYLASDMFVFSQDEDINIIIKPEIKNEPAALKSLSEDERKSSDLVPVQADEKKDLNHENNINNAEEEPKTSSLDNLRGALKSLSLYDKPAWQDDYTTLSFTIIKAENNNFDEYEFWESIKLDDLNLNLLRSRIIFDLIPVGRLKGKGYEVKIKFLEKNGRFIDGLSFDDAVDIFIEQASNLYK